MNLHDDKQPLMDDRPYKPQIVRVEVTAQWFAENAAKQRAYEDQAPTVGRPPFDRQILGHSPRPGRVVAEKSMIPGNGNSIFRPGESRIVLIEAMAKRGSPMVGSGHEAAPSPSSEAARSG